MRKLLFLLLGLGFGGSFSMLEMLSAYKRRRSELLAKTMGGSESDRLLSSPQSLLIVVRFYR